MTAHATPDPAAARMLLVQLEALGLTPDDLVAFAAGTTGTGAITLGHYVEDRVHRTLTKGQRTVWRPYLDLMVHGYPGLCACMCPACLDAFSGDSAWQPCACVRSGRCECRRADLEHGAVAAGSCLEHCTGVGDRALSAVRLADWEHLSRWAQLRAQKRLAVRNRARGAQGRPTHAHDGRSACEHLRNAASLMYRLALAEDLPGVRRNLALELTVKPRPATTARAYSTEQLEQLWQAIFTSGGNDPELDMLVVWLALETGARRGGPIGLRVGDLQFAANRIRLGEKNGKVDEQPASAQLLAALLGHAIRRGCVVLHTAPGLDAGDVGVADVLAGRALLRTDAPVLYYATTRPVTRSEVASSGEVVRVPVLDTDGRPLREPRPLSRKRFETLWGRLKRDLVWLDEMHGRPHDLRKTMGTFVERAFGHAVSQRWLRHTVNDVTGTYTVAADAEVRVAHDWIIGRAG